MRGFFCFLASLVVILGAITSLASSSSAPNWVESVPTQDENWKYYVGRSSDVANEQMGTDIAVKDAYKQATAENFGVAVEINSEAYQDLNAAKSTVRIRENAAANLEDFENVGWYATKTDSGRFNVYMLFRYSKKAIQREKARQATKNVAPPKTEISIQGNEQDRAKGALRIVTEPPGAVVYVGGERYGKTPLLLIGQMEPGNYSVRLDHPKYELVEEQVILVPGKESKISVTLKPAIAKLNVTTTPSNAIVLVQGQMAGVTPLDGIEIPAGVPVRVEISHAESEKFTQELTAERAGFRELNLKLPLKPASLTVFTEPASASVLVNNKVFESGTLMPLEAGTYAIQIKKSGYVDQSFSIELKGGERLSRNEKLTPLSDRQKYLTNYPWIGGIGILVAGVPLQDQKSSTPQNGGFAHWGLDFSLEKKVWDLLGLRLFAGTGSYLYVTDESEKSKRRNAGFEDFVLKSSTSTFYGLGLPLYLIKKLSYLDDPARDPRRLLVYVMPKIGRERAKYTWTRRYYAVAGTTATETDTEFDESRSFLGGEIGLDFYLKLNLGIRAYADGRKYSGSTIPDSRIFSSGGATLLFAF